MIYINLELSRVFQIRNNIYIDFFSKRKPKNRNKNEKRLSKFYEGFIWSVYDVIKIKIR
jgi:hypothetical protein